MFWKRKQMSHAMRKCVFGSLRPGKHKLPCKLQRPARILTFWIYRLEVSFCLGSEQQRRWSDCADAQADLCLCCSHLAYDTFSHVVAQMQNKTDKYVGQRAFNGHIVYFRLLKKCALLTYRRHLAKYCVNQYFALFEPNSFNDRRKRPYGRSRG